MGTDSGAYFDDVADRWDTMRESFFSEAVSETAFAIASVRPGRLAADVGAGTGFVAEGLLARGIRVIAVDASEAMLGQLRDKFESSTEIDCRRGDAESLPIPNDHVDYVFANMYLHHVESPPDAISEMVRVLRPGGRLVITDLEEHSFEFLRTEHHDRWLGFDPKAVQGWLEGAGLSQAGYQCLDERCCTEDVTGGQAASIGIFAAFGTK